MRYYDPGGSPRGHRPEGIPAVATQTQTLAQIEEESIGGDSQVEVLEPLEGHNIIGCTVDVAKRLGKSGRGVVTI